ncbi:hypothetical protein LIER_42249 [Lithospermum erythrorhizon]|uniref:Retrovirus-related Pol polyprotein from transposon TNT 1-94-like beta-barrel domain-containing protein n=1 Tax=Lithospermum erythrorhizon TaxID=34254 RepID=A0AAV3RNA1_LITER
MGVDFNDEKGENNVAIVDHENDLIVVAAQGDMGYTSNEEEWVIDSGASFHVTPHCSFFSNYSKGDVREAKMGNNGVSKIIAPGDIQLKIELGHTIILKEVRHIPDFRLSLMSSRKLDDEG